MDTSFLNVAYAILLSISIELYDYERSWYHAILIFILDFVNRKQASFDVDRMLIEFVCFCGYRISIFDTKNK